MSFFNGVFKALGDYLRFEMTSGKKDKKASGLSCRDEEDDDMWSFEDMEEEEEDE